MTAQMPEGGGVQVGGKWYTAQQYRALNAGVPGAAQSTQTIDGRQILAATLAQYNLPGLSLDAAWNAYVSSGNNMDYFTNTWLPQQPAFQAVYPAYSKLAAQGNGITIAQYQNYNQTLNQLAQQYGVPAGFFTPDRVAQALLSGQSTAEIQAGLNRAAQIVADPDIQSWMNAHPADGGLGGHQLTPGEIYAAQTDPAFGEQAAADRFTQAQIGGAALGQGQNIDQATAQQLQLAGVTQSSAQTGFEKIGEQQGLYGALPGNNGEKNLDQATQIGAQFGTSASDALAVQQRAAQRVAAFKSGGQLSTGQGGFAGAGSAQAA